MSGTTGLHRADAAPTDGVGDPDISAYLRLNQGPGMRCSFVARLAVLSPQERANFDAAMASDTTQVSAIVGRLAELGVAVSPDTIRRHRGNRCLTCRT